MENQIYRVAVVVPVYQGQHVLSSLLGEIARLTEVQKMPSGASFQVVETILVHDGSIDSSDEVMRGLAERHPFVRLIWLSRNYGQHAATLAGMASTTADWVVTLDEDGQHNPADIGRLLSQALKEEVQLVYARPQNPAPHGPLRNLFSRLAKGLFFNLAGDRSIGPFHSFRLIDGEIARSLAAYCANNVYLDVALSWVVARAAHCPVDLRDERGRPSGYTYAKLLSHFWRLLIASGTKPLRLIALLGGISILVGVGISFYAIFEKLHSRIPVQGWTSLIIVLCLFCGVILFSLAVLAEYLGVVVNMAMGKPLYLIVSKPASGGRTPPRLPLLEAKP